MKKHEKQIWQQIAQLVQLKISKFVQNFPLNVDQLNFEDLLTRCARESYRRAFSCNIRLDDSKTVVDLVFHNETFGYHEKCEVSRLPNVKVDITYTLAEDNKTGLRKETRCVGFDRVEFGRNHLAFKEISEGAEDFGFLIQKEIINCEKWRIWIEE